MSWGSCHTGLSGSTISDTPMTAIVSTLDVTVVTTFVATAALTTMFVSAGSYV